MEIVQPSVHLEWITPACLSVIEKAGRICYKSEDKMTQDSAAPFVKKLVAQGHHSVIEHASASLRIICDRGVSHEIVRHRLASYSQESTRYCNYAGKGLSVICPPNLDKDSFLLWYKTMLHIEQTYNHLIINGQSPQIARSVLPTCLKTELVMTANFREWLHFFELRLKGASHPQIRVVAYMAWKSLVDEVSVFESCSQLAETVVRDGLYPLPKIPTTSQYNIDTPVGQKKEVEPFRGFW